MRENKDFGNKPRGLLILILASLIVASLGCNLPLIGKSSAGGDQGLAETLQSSGLQTVKDIQLSAGVVTIQYEILPEDSLEVMVMGWVNALAAAAESYPEADAYLLETSSGGEAYLDIRADGFDARGYADEELSLDLFLERLEITDRRPLIDRISGDVADLGLDGINIQALPGSLLITYYAAPAASEAELFDQWWGIFDAVSLQEEFPDRIQIRALMPDDSAFLVGCDGDSLRAYTRGEISAVSFLAGLTISEEAHSPRE